MKVAPVSNICYLVLHAHLCPVGPRVLYSCSSTIPTIHIREALWTPLSQSLIHSYFLGPQSSLGLYYYHVLMPCFTALFKIVRGAPVLFWMRSVFAVSTSPVTLSGSQSFTAIDANPESVSKTGRLRCG